MAKEEKAKPKGEEKHEGRKEGEGGKKAKAKHLHQIITTQAHDGTWSHEHVYKDKKEDMHSHPPVFAGTSQSLEDMHQHVDDHWGPQAEEQGQGEPDGDEGQGAGAPADAGAGEQPQE